MRRLWLPAVTRLQPTVMPYDEAGEIFLDGGRQVPKTSLDALERSTLGTGLWKKLARLNSLMFASKSEEAFSLGSLAALVLVRSMPLQRSCHCYLQAV